MHFLTVPIFVNQRLRCREMLRLGGRRGTKDGRLIGGAGRQVEALSVLRDGAPVRSAQQDIQRPTHVDGTFGAEHNRRIERLSVQQDRHGAGRRTVEAPAAMPARALDAHSHAPVVSSMIIWPPVLRASLAAPFGG